MANKRKPPGSGWIGVDLDGTLATYTTWKGPCHIGKPIPAMVKRIKKWLKQGYEVRILTARAYHDGSPDRIDQVVEAVDAIEKFCFKQFGRILPVTCTKDLGMIELWDDRAIAVKSNTGKKLGGKSRV